MPGNQEEHRESFRTDYIVFKAFEACGHISIQNFCINVLTYSFSLVTWPMFQVKIKYSKSLGAAIHLITHNHVT